MRLAPALASIALTWAGPPAVLAQENQVALHDRICVSTAASPIEVAAQLPPEKWRVMFADDDASFVSRVSVDDPADVVMARTVTTGDVTEAVCSVQRAGGDFEALKAQFAAATGLTPVRRYSNRTVAAYIARVVDGAMIDADEPDLNVVRRDPAMRIFSLSRIGEDALIVVSFPQ